MVPQSKVNLLVIGLTPELTKEFGELLAMLQVRELSMDLKKIIDEDSKASMPEIILCGPAPENVSSIEVAQTLRMKFSESIIYYFYDRKTGYDRTLFQKNGFTDVFLIPFDLVQAKSMIRESIGKVSNGVIRVYKPVQIIDINPGDQLNFETRVYFAANNRYIRVGQAGEPLNEDLVEKFKRGHYSAFQVPVDQMQLFYQYSAERLKHIQDSSDISETERKERLFGAVRNLMTGLLADNASSFETGQNFMHDCNEIIKTFVVREGAQDWYGRVVRAMGDQKNSYSHATNVSTLAALFSMGLGIGEPEDLALAGILHDIGLAELPNEIQKLEPQEMSKEQFEIYKKHPELSCALIQERKLVVPEIVMKAIAQHHELYNGKGYPNGYQGDRICKEAQILALADRFDYLTRLKDGKKAMSAQQAVEFLNQQQMGDTSNFQYNPDILKKLIVLMSSEQNVA